MDSVDRRSRLVPRGFILEEDRALETRGRKGPAGYRGYHRSDGDRGDRIVIMGLLTGGYRHRPDNVHQVDVGDIRIYFFRILTFTRILHVRQMFFKFVKVRFRNFEYLTYKGKGRCSYLAVSKRYKFSRNVLLLS